MIFRSKLIAMPAAIVVPVICLQLALAQAFNPRMEESGTQEVAGRAVRFIIRRLPVSSYPALPQSVAQMLLDRGCMIPQTYDAHHPENVVHGSFQRAGSSDWAVLCSAKGKVSLLVFLEGDTDHPISLLSVPESDRLQAHDLTGVYGFDWAIDRASPYQVRQTQAGSVHRHALPDHDALVDMRLEGHTTYHLYVHGVWTEIEAQD